MVLLVIHREKGPVITDDVFTPGPGRTVFSLRPPKSDVDRFREEGVWRDGNPVQDLVRWRDETPDAVALIALQTETGETTSLTYRDYARCVERYAGALAELGVGPGQVVALQLPNVWQVPPLLLACFRLGAVVAPVMPTIRSRELERVLHRVGATVCVTADVWDGYDHAGALAEMAPRLPKLRHRVVLGSRIGAGEVDFTRHFEQPRETRPLDDAWPDPDQVCVVLFTSGTSGRPKAALHTFNTEYATAAAHVTPDDRGPAERFFTPHSLTHTGGIFLCLMRPLLTGGSGVVADRWVPEAIGPFLEATAVTQVLIAPVFLAELMPFARPGSLRLVTTLGTATPAPLVEAVARDLGLPLRTCWGMTESGGTLMRADDPPDWALHSAGRVSRGSELDLRSDLGEITAERPGRLYIRGATVCLATVGRDTGELVVPADHDHGWYDTGDLAIPDGRGGIRLMGRDADRIGGVLMIPASDVESALLAHPAVRDVALVGYPDPAGGELPAAVVVAAGSPPTLADLREHLAALGMTEWYWPTRLELVDQLPRNAMGKIRKDVLARDLTRRSTVD
ncbi:AMP-binding protein [Amycolatopsis rhabdoformis]|uniref:AMP-binding protein n=1 Tax=Amycolatopsis rhabdoformis TaxID=1448059 RepID=A0ABZ1IHS5_9PSEU|nr:AMP-binding protein [Amycolatopsis rhabdoformis]WSE33263.1 AMP-binding protein [Amycolatopsis rhabdoformis]